MKYLIKVQRTIVEEAYVEIEAESESDAWTVDVASLDADWEEKDTLNDSDYEVLDVECLDDEEDDEEE